jgi:hypothetical protein
VLFSLLLSNRFQAASEVPAKNAAIKTLDSQQSEWRAVFCGCSLSAEKETVYDISGAFGLNFWQNLTAVLTHRPV